MKKHLFFFTIFFVMVSSFSQTELTQKKIVDSLFREDQFYIGLTYNILLNQPVGLSQNGFSTGLQVGFIRDIPITKSRQYAIGLGFGVSTNSYNQNLLINKETNNYFFSILSTSETLYTKNKFYTHTVDFPLEFRWRNATPEIFKFWRIYAGVKMSYVFANASKFEGDLGRLRHANINVFNKFQYGMTLSIGYNTWNIYAYYGLNPLFDSQRIKDQSNLELSSFKGGLILYIL